MEDPLVAIKKRELEDRKRLLDNPLKMKALKVCLFILGLFIKGGVQKAIDTRPLLQKF